MTNVTWIAQHRHVAGLSVAPGLSAAVFQWSADPFWAGSSIPWADPEYPTLLLYGIGFDLTTDATVATRRIRLIIDQPNGAHFEIQSNGTQAASLTRRWEFAPGFALDTSLALDTYREALPRGMLVLPGLVGGPEAQIQLAVLSTPVGPGDIIGPVSLRGALLYP